MALAAGELNVEVSVDKIALQVVIQPQRVTHTMKIIKGHWVSVAQLPISDTDLALTGCVGGDVPQGRAQCAANGGGRHQGQVGSQQCDQRNHRSLLSAGGDVNKS